MSKALTPRQTEVLNYIKECINTRGCPPTMREIADAFNIASTNAINDHLRALERKGALTKGAMKSRGHIPAVFGTGRIVEVPMLGRVPAGDPVLALEEHDTTVRIDSFFIGNSREVFGLRVEGSSMIDDGIHDGDYIFVTKKLRAKPGDIVVAMVDGEATVKRFYPEQDHVRLQPANEAMDPIIIPHADFRSVDIIGVVVGMYRKVH